MGWYAIPQGADPVNRTYTSAHYVKYNEGSQPVGAVPKADFDNNWTKQLPYGIDRLLTDVSVMFAQLPVARRKLFGGIANDIQVALQRGDIELALTYFVDDIQNNPQADPQEVQAFEALFNKLEVN